MVDLSGKEYCHHFQFIPHITHTYIIRAQYDTLPEQRAQPESRNREADQTNASKIHHILQSCEAARAQGMNGTPCAVGLVIFSHHLRPPPPSSLEQQSFPKTHAHSGRHQDQTREKKQKGERQKTSTVRPLG